MLLMVPLLVVGCLSVETDTLYNNSGQDLSLVVKFPGITTNITAVVKSGEYIRFYSPYIEVHHRDGTWHYGIKEPVDGYRTSKSIANQTLVNLQIQPDGAIYVISPAASGIVTNFPRQPRGFPLRPEQY